MDRFFAANVTQTVTPTPYPGNFGFAQGTDTLPLFSPTNPGPFWVYYITESIRNVIVAAGLTPDPLQHDQFYQALAILAIGD